MTDKENRNPDGTFKTGNNANPDGRGGNQKGWQPYGQRAITLAEKYTREEILAFANNPELAEERLSYWDALCITHMARAIEKRLTVTDSGSGWQGAPTTA